MKFSLNKKSIAALAVVLAIVLFFLISLIVKSATTTKKYMYFYSYDSEDICREVREYPRNSSINLLERFVSDLLLGPITIRYRRIFALGTKLDFCVVKGDELHVGVSEDALFLNPDSMDIRTSADLLRKNIVKNFTNFNKIYIYIGGTIVFQE